MCNGTKLQFQMDHGDQEQETYSTVSIITNFLVLQLNLVYFELHFQFDPLRYNPYFYD